MTDSELDAAGVVLEDSFKEILDSPEPPTAESNALLEGLADDIDAVRAEKDRRATEAAEAESRRAELAQRIASDDAPETVAAADVPAPRAKSPAVPKRRSLNVSMQSVREHAPKVDLETAGGQLIVTAAAEVVSADIARGGKISDLGILASATYERARVLGDHSGRVQTAQIRKEHDVVLSAASSPQEVAEAIKHLTNQDVLTAAGGWCAPSQPLYDFFSISCEDGLLDLPTTGIQRGGITVPVSSSIADILGTSNTTFHWTETNDQAAATGSPTKPCVRVPCPSTVEYRLQADGLCVTAGFLTSEAWPELIAHHISEVMSAHVHDMNRRRILTLIANTEAVAVVEDGVGLVAPILTAIDLAAVDYRELFAMCDNDVLEVILPRWVKAAMRSDLAYRPGVDNMLAVSMSEVQAWFDVRNIRVQWVADWQTRASTKPGGATGLTSFPNNIEFLIYAAGTFLLGDGPTIDLGVIRDSTLNATNDFTASWMEEAWLIAKIGHLARHYVVDVCNNGAVGIGTAITCV